MFPDKLPERTLPAKNHPLLLVEPIALVSRIFLVFNNIIEHLSTIIILKNHAKFSGKHFESN